MIQILLMREFCVCVCLYTHTLGFQISGGESAGRMDLGTIISSITPGGPADLDGRLRPGVWVCFALKKI